MLYLICIIPILLYFFLIKGMDGFSLASISRMVESFVWGVVCCLVMFFAGARINSDSVWLGPLLEEIIKAAPLFVAVRRKRTAFFAETLIYGAAIGAGFALLENILYVRLSQDFLVGDAILRGFGTALLHMGCTALCGSIFLLCSRTETKFKALFFAVTVVAGLMPSFVIHYLYNLFLLPELLQMIITIAVLLTLFWLTYAFDNRKIHDWLDLCINNDMRLLKAIREGKLSETQAGEYLIATREKFKPEVFFDICVYLGLYLELSISAKSRMILKEAEMDIPISEEEHNANLDKIRELQALQKNIGISGLSVLSPIIDSKAMDSWVLDSLL